MQNQQTWEMDGDAVMQDAETALSTNDGPDHQEMNHGSNHVSGLVGSNAATRSDAKAEDSGPAGVEPIPVTEAADHATVEPERSTNPAESLLLQETGNQEAEFSRATTDVAHSIPNPAGVETAESGSKVGPSPAKFEVQEDKIAETSTEATVPDKQRSTENGTKAGENAASLDVERPASGSPARVYLKEHVNDYLLEGMKWLALTRPSNGLLALGQYLCSADRWRHEPKHASKSVLEFHSYWLAYQNWLSQGHAGKTEEDYRATL